MLENIIRNAIRFSPVGSAIQVNVIEAGTTLTISVIDDGPGIPEEMMTTIFERYSFSSVPREVPSGMGIGLSIAQGVAELHGGSISLKNRPTAGCDFTISLPRHFPSGENS
jgi:signal transduction histidine kinase